MSTLLMKDYVATRIGDEHKEEYAAWSARLLESVTDVYHPRHTELYATWRSLEDPVDQPHIPRLDNFNVYPPSYFLDMLRSTLPDLLDSKGYWKTAFEAQQAKERPAPGNSEEFIERSRQQREDAMRQLKEADEKRNAETTAGALSES